MKSYCSFLVINPAHANAVKKLGSPEEWHLRLRPDPSRRFWFGQNIERGISHPEALGQEKPDDTPGQLVVVQADKECLATNVVHLACACHDVIEGNPGERIGLRPAFEIPTDREDRESVFRNVFQTRGYFDKFYCSRLIPVAAQMAATAWPNKSLVYAIHKLARSLAEESITWWSTHPYHGQVFEKESTEHSHHVTTSIAINLAFSAIEELELQVKSSQKKPRFTDNETGRWNQTVLDETEKRLVDSGIDPEETIEWVLRGHETLAEDHIKPNLGIPSPSSVNRNVRDVTLTLPEALHFCSYIRNFMTAHRFREVTECLGPYEVHNVQSVARKLILQKSGFWNVWADDLVTNK